MNKSLAHNQLSQTQRISRSRYTGKPILEELNTVYGYYATSRFVTEKEWKQFMEQPTYQGDKHPAEIKFDQSSHIC